MSSLKKNFLYSATYQILGLIVPLLLTPYVSRVLGPEGVGTYSYTYSVVYYFMLVALLGMQYYGNRSVARVRDDRKKISKVFWEIYILQLLVTIIVTFIYIIFIICSTNYKIYYLIEILYVISVGFDINWLYSGLEKFKFTVTRTAIIKILSAILIFIFVKTSEDLWIYIFILSASTLLNQIVLWPSLFKYVDFHKVKLADSVKHLKATCILFIPVLAFSVYNVMDKIMIGVLDSPTGVGYYENAEKIINIPFYVVSALGTVTLPRIANLNSGKEKNADKIKVIIEKSLVYILFLLVPIMFGIFVVSDYLVPLYLGAKFIPSIKPLKILAVILIFKSISQIIRQQYLVPMEMDKIYIKVTLVGAIINFFMNLILILKYQVIGACIATVITEIITAIYQMFIIDKKMGILKDIKFDIVKIFVKSAIMFGIILLIGKFIQNELVRTISQIIVGILIYGILNVRFLKSNITFILRKK